MKLFVSLALMGLSAAAPFGAGQEDQTGPVSASDADKQAALDVHNQARAAVGSPPIAWDDGLASDAQAWAEENAATNDMHHADSTQNPNEGENIFQGWVSNGGQSNTDGWKIATEWWIDEEIAKYQCGQVIDESNYSHYTQVIWSATTHVGMGYAKASSGGKSYVVARYKAAGNVIGQMACPAGATPSPVNSTSSGGDQTSSSGGTSSSSAPATSPTPPTQPSSTQPPPSSSGSSGSTNNGSTQPPPSGSQKSGFHGHRHYSHVASKPQAAASDEECES